MRQQPALVCMDCQRFALAGTKPSDIAHNDDVVAAANMVMEQARDSDWVLFHTQLKTTGGPSDRTNAASGPIDPLRPRRSEFVIERAAPSAYAAPEFERFMSSRYGAPTYLIGFGGATSVLATLFDAAGRGHALIPIVGAIGSSRVGAFDRDAVSEFVLGLSAQLGFTPCVSAVAFGSTPPPPAKRVEDSRGDSA